MPQRTKTPSPHTRAARYVAQMPAAVSGQGGHRATFAVAIALAHGFALDPGEAWGILCDYNTRCAPPWSERELRHKLTSAAKLTRHPKPRGHLLGLRPLPDAPAQVPEPFQLVDPQNLPPAPIAPTPDSHRIVASLHNLESAHPGLLICEDDTLFAAELKIFRATYRRKSTQEY